MSIRMQKKKKNDILWKRHLLKINEELSGKLPEVDPPVALTHAVGQSRLSALAFGYYMGK